MAKKKRDIPANYSALDDLELRVRQFTSINQIALGNDLSDKERAAVEGQQVAFGSVLGLIKQIKKGGSIWRGGYLDNVGVVFTDQVQEIIDNAN